MTNHLARILGWPRVKPVTHNSVEPAKPDFATEQRALRATADFVDQRMEIDGMMREVRRQLASGALRIVNH